jgi:hypothetical protein
MFGEKMKNKLLDLYEYTKKVNKELVEKGKSISACCLIMKKSKEVIMMALLFRDSKEKEIMRKMLKEYILRQEIIGYIFVSDCKMSVIDTKDMNKSVAYDVVMTNLYTAKEKLSDMIFYEGTKIIDMKDNKEFQKFQKLNNRNKAEDMWDLWGSEVEISDENHKNYEDFKKLNPELFKDVK